MPLTAEQLLRNIVDRASLVVAPHGVEYYVPPDDINAARLWLSSEDGGREAVEAELKANEQAAQRYAERESGLNPKDSKE